MAKQKSQTDAQDAAQASARPDGDMSSLPAQAGPGQTLASEATDPSAAKDAAVEERLVVTGPAQGRWRAGHSFTSEPVTLSVADLTDDQVVAITNDPALTVMHLPVPQ